MEYLIPYMELDNALGPEKLFWIFPSLFNFAWGWKLSLCGLCGGIWVSFHNMILEISIFSLFALSPYLQSLRLLDPRLSGSDRYLGRFWFWFVEMWNPNSIFLCTACCCWRGGCPCLSVFSKYTRRSELLCAKTLNSIWRHGFLHLFVGMNLKHIQMKCFWYLCAQIWLK